MTGAKKEKMPKLVSIDNGTATVDSHGIAENFGKRHDNVLKKIKGLLELEEAKGMFWEAAREDKKHTGYLMGRNGFCILTAGFSGSEAMQWRIRYLQAFDDAQKKISGIGYAKKALLRELEGEQMDKLAEHYAALLENLPGKKKQYKHATRWGLNALVKYYADTVGIHTSLAWDNFRSMWLKEYGENIHAECVKWEAERSGDHMTIPRYLWMTGHLDEACSLVKYMVIEDYFSRNGLDASSSKLLTSLRKIA